MITFASLPRKPLYIPLFSYRVRAGFPSPATDYMDKTLDLTEHLIKHPAATYFAIAEGNSMKNHGIFNGDLLIVDRAVKAAHQHIIIAAINGELTCKQLDSHRRLLISGNKNFAPIPITDEMEMINEGVVIASVRYHVRAG